MKLTRRTALLWGAVLATLGVGTYEFRPNERALETDPDGTKFVYRDGIITRVDS